MNKIEIGMLTKPQGLKGEFRVKHKPSALQLFFDLDQVEINGKTYNVLKVTDRGGFFILKTKEITSIDQVELMRTAKVYTYITDEEAIEVNHNVGYRVQVNGKEIGTVMEVNNYGATDVYMLGTGKSFAVVPGLFINVDDENQIIEVDAKILEEVLV
jgi:16S rRNA processing protein RimM